MKKERISGNIDFYFIDGKSEPKLVLENCYRRLDCIRRGQEIILLLANDELIMPEESKYIIVDFIISDDSNSNSKVFFGNLEYIREEKLKELGI